MESIPFSVLLPHYFEINNPYIAIASFYKSGDKYVVFSITK